MKKTPNKENYTTDDLEMKCPNCGKYSNVWDTDHSPGGNICRRCGKVGDFRAWVKETRLVRRIPVGLITPDETIYEG